MGKAGVWNAGGLIYGTGVGVMERVDLVGWRLSDRVHRLSVCFIRPGRVGGQCGGSERRR